MKLNEKIRLVLTTARCCREINPDQVIITPRHKHQSTPKVSKKFCPEIKGNLILKS